MARYKLQGRARDTWGNAISGLDIYIYKSGTGRTQDAIIYTSRTSTTAISASPQIASDQYGSFNFWVDDTDYTAATTKFDIYADGLEYTYVDIFNIKHHGILSGLKFDDHPRYPSVSAAEVITGEWRFTNPVSAADPTLDEHLVTKGYGDIQYAPTSGSGTTIITNEWIFTTPVSGVAPSADNEFTIKQYVDAQILSVSAGGGLIEPIPNTFAVNPDNTTIQIVSDEVAVIQTGLDHVNLQNIGTKTHAELEIDISSIEASAAGSDSTLTDHIASASVHVSQTYIDGADASTLASANSYTDTKVLSVSAGGGLIEPVDNVFAVNPDNLSIAVSNDKVILRPEIETEHNFTLPVSGQAPTLDEHLVTKLYLDTNFPSAAVTSAGNTIITNNWYFTEPVSGVAPSADNEFTIKQYVDTEILSVSAALAGDFINRDGTSTLTGNWDAGPYDINVGGDVHISGSLFTSGASIYTTAIHPLTTSAAAITLTDGGPVSLYYDGIKSFETYTLGTDEGFKLPHSGDGLGTSGDILFTQSSYGHLTIHNPTYQGRFIVKGTKSGDVDSLMIQSYPHSGVILYHAGDRTFETQAGGIRIWSATNTTRLYHNGVDFYNYNVMEGGRFFLQGTQTGGGINTLIIGDPDGAVQLYHAGNIVINTVPDGFYLGTSNQSAIWISSGNMYFDNYNHGGYTILNGKNTDGDGQTTAKFDPDGAAELYYAGEKVFETIDGGVRIYDTDATDYLDIKHAGTTATLTNSIDNGNIYFYVHDSGSVQRNPLALVPTGAVIRGTNNDIALVSTVGKLDIRGPSNVEFEITSTAYGEFNILQTNGYTRFHSAVAGNYFMFEGVDAGSVTRSMIKSDPDGSVDLYYAGNKVFETTEYGFTATTSGGATILETTSEGINVSDGTTTAVIEIVSGADEDLYIRNTDHGGHIVLTGETDAGVEQILIEADPGGIVSLYYNGNIAFQTVAHGIRINDPTVGSLVDIFQGVGGEVWTKIASTINSQNIALMASNSSGTTVPTIIGDPDGSVELYHAGNKVAETFSLGFQSSGRLRIDDGTHIGELYYVGDNLRLRNTFHGGEIEITGEDASGTQRTIFNADPDGSVDLYSYGTKKFETTSTGAKVSGDLEYLNISTVTAQTTASNSDVILTNAPSGSPFTVYLEESDNASITVKKIDNEEDTTVEGLSGNIDGAANKTLTAQYERATFVWDGTNWFII